MGSGFGEGETYVGTFVEGSAADLDAAVALYAGPINGIDQGADLVETALSAGVLALGAVLASLQRPLSGRSGPA